MSFTSRGFRDLKAPSSSPTIAEVDGVFVNRADISLQSSKLKDHAPLIRLEKFPPRYANRTRIRVSILLQRSRAKTYTYTGPIWVLAYYIDFPRMKLVEAYYAIQKLRSTPGDLMARYFLTGGVNGGLSLAGQYIPDISWMGRDRVKLLTGPPADAKERKMHTSGDEKIEHIAFHPTMMVLAMATTYARVHLFDLRTNTFLDYFLCATDNPDGVVITAITFNSTNQLAVGMDTGFVDIWTVDLGSHQPASSEPFRGPLFAAATGDEFGGSPMRMPAPRLRFFDSKSSPGTRAILANIGKGKGTGTGMGTRTRTKRQRSRAAVERVELIPGGFLAHRKLIGSVTAVAFSPSGTHLAIGTSTGGVWIYNATATTSYRAYTGSFSAASAKCRSLSWGVPPGVKHVPLQGEAGGVWYQLGTGDTALVAGMDDGAVVYIPVRDNGPSSITLGSVVEFYPSKLAPGAPHDTAVSHALLVPSPPPQGADELWSLFPTLVVALVDSPGIHVFRLFPESVLKASVPGASAVHVAPALGLRARSWGLYKKVVRVLRVWCGVRNTVRPVHIGTLDTSPVVFLPKTAAPAVNNCDTLRLGHVWKGYGGAIRSMAIDPTARRLIVSFSGSGDTRVEDSVVWFDARRIRATTSVLGALQVLRPQRVICGDGDGGGVAEVRFAGGFEGGACAGMITSGGKGVGIFPAWIAKEGGGNGRE
ncbi:hypothetical protein Q9L58_000690 [Maublancomyces gigas]|uniref:Uncharacterized protein n=1 Tax=Discina gigas TaxID=1032678 RepID=A0ABR3GW58_9PEZI